MKNQFCIVPFSLLFLLTAALLHGNSGLSQEAVQVRFEPRHKPVFENEYVRILNVWLPPGDTTLYHIHSTPSLFNFYTDAVLSTQVRTGPWEISTPKAGFCWYRSFQNDTLIHRIINIDSVPCHVMDIELLKAYQPEYQPAAGMLPFELLFQNEKAYAWHISDPEYIDLVIKQRGPIIAELIAGEGITFHNMGKQETIDFTPGMYLYIEPNSSFYFSNKKQDPINMILFELK